MPKYCECGCGQIVTPDSRFISGHNSKGKHPTKESIEKGLETKKINKEIREGKRLAPKPTFCECGCGQLCKIGNRYITGHWIRGKVVWNKGLTKETDSRVNKQAESNKGHISPMKGKTKENCKSIKRQAEKMIGDKNPAKRPEVRKKISKYHQEMIFTEEHRKHLSKAQIKRFQEHPVSERTKQKSSNTFKQLWQDPEFIKKMTKSWNKKPNKPEKLIYSLLQNILPNEYAINVKGHIVIDGKIPDFVNINGQKKLIEFNGCYYHNCPICFSNSGIDGLKETEDRIKLFKKYGYKTLVIWEHELEDMKAVVNRILEFHNIPSLSTTIQSKLE